MARKDIVDNEVLSFYHCVSRCVRRAFLCGRDDYSGINYEHRKDWVEDRLKLLEACFAIDVAAFAIMSNHLHLILRIRPDLVQLLSDKEVARRWLMLYPKRKNLNGDPCMPSEEEIDLILEDEAVLLTLRERLGSISWLHKCLKEFIATKANKEDHCNGAFWEGRFKSQRLLDDESLLACMSYVDLNLIRALMADRPESSPYTSIQNRIETRQAHEKVHALSEERKLLSEHAQEKLELNDAQKLELATQFNSRKADHWLAPIEKNKWNTKNRLGLLPITRDQYIELIDWTGREIKAGKRGAIPITLLPIFKRLDLDVNRWVDMVSQFGSIFWRMVGKTDGMLLQAIKADRSWFKGVRCSQFAFKNKTG